MIVEYVRYALPAEVRISFEQDYARVGPVMARSPHCLGWELRRSQEDPSQYVVRIEWDSREGHELHYRATAEFRAFFGVMKAYSDHRLQMEHFELVTGSRP